MTYFIHHIVTKQTSSKVKQIGDFYSYITLSNLYYNSKNIF